MNYNINNAYIDEEWKYFTGYKYDEKGKLLSMISPRMSKYGKRLHDQLLKNIIKSGIKSVLY